MNFGFIGLTLLFVVVDGAPLVVAHLDFEELLRVASLVWVVLHAKLLPVFVDVGSAAKSSEQFPEMAVEMVVAVERLAQVVEGVLRPRAVHHNVRTAYHAAGIVEVEPREVRYDIRLASSYHALPPPDE